MTLFMLCLRGLFLRGRTYVLLALSLLLGVVCVVLRYTVSDYDRTTIYGTMSGALTLSLGIAFVGLMQGISAFGDEREGGTLTLLLATTTPRWRIVLDKFVAAWLSTFVVAVPALLGCVVLGSGSYSVGKLIVTLLLAGLLSSAAYVGLFVLLSLVWTRGLLVGLAYVAVWEGSLAAHVHNLRNLSVAAYGRRLIAGVGPNTELSVPGAGWILAGIILVVVAALTVAVSSWRLPRLEVT